MGIHNREYKGAIFTIHTDELHGKWHWSYTLGTKSYNFQDSPLPSESLAVKEAEDEAHRRIDRGADK